MTESDTEFGTERRVVMIIEIAPYGINSSGAAWRAKLAETLISLGYKSSKSDSD